MEVIQSNEKFSDEILLKYLNNLDMNLYEVDSLVFDFLSNDKFKEIGYLKRNAAIFMRLSRLKHTKVKDRQDVDEDFLKSCIEKARIYNYN